VKDRANHCREASVPLFTEPGAVFETEPDVIVEVLGGLEPARTIVLDALRRGIPVVTANKTLVATHGDELFAAAAQCGTPLRCEAAVVAGVPFLGTFASRPLASAVDRVAGILNGTSNFILARVGEGMAAADALADAQRQGYAEPDPSKDLNGSDAAEKLAILLRHFARLSIQPSEITTTSIDGIGPDEMTHARELGGRIKPVAVAQWRKDEVVCFAGPGFVSVEDPLAWLDGVLNGVRLERRDGAPLYFCGPGAGPEVTARTILDDVFEALSNRDVPPLGSLPRARVEAPTALGWYVSLRAPRLPDAEDVADLLAAHGVWVRRWGTAHTDEGIEARALLTFPCPSSALQRVLGAVASASGCAARSCPIVEVERD
jgi:homoserine dehydrogenase